MERQSPSSVSGSTESTNNAFGIREDFSALKTSTPGVKERYHNFRKPSADKRVYRGLLLSNGLKVLLVSDPTTEKSAAGLSVSVGTYSDPDILPGLSHLCKRLLVLASKKYPEENGFKKFISEHGGNFSSSCWWDRTLFSFNISSIHLNEALEMFSQFFISPVFSESAMVREINAIHSEYEYLKSSGSCSSIQLKKSISDPKHPYHRFNIGNKETLQTIPEAKGIDVREELLKFHNYWYSANIMSLIVVGKESLDELEAMVSPLFSIVENKSVTAPSWPTHPFPPELRGRTIYSLPIKDLGYLNINFPLPSTTKYYKSKPVDYLTNLIGHEGPGSLLSALKRRGWGYKLCCGTSMTTRGFDFLTIFIDLTEEGINHIDEIITLLFQYIAMLKLKGPQRWIWEEQKNLMDVAFRFKDVLEPSVVVGHHLDLLEEYPMEEILTVYSLMSEWKPELITELLSLLTPENAIIQIAAKAFEFKCTMTEHWYGTKYWVEDIDEKTLKRWSEVQITEELHLPSPNEYIPSNLELEKCEDSTSEDVAPEIVKDINLIRLWYKKDNEFLLPKAMVTFNLVSPLANADPVNANLTQMLVELLVDSLEECTYAASLAGLSYRVMQVELYGINITIKGYDDKIHVLLDKVFDHLVAFKVDSQSFDIIKEKRIKDIKNKEADQPIVHAIRQEELCLSSLRWTTSQLLAAAQDATPEQLNNFFEKFIRKVHIEGLVFGNVNRERAIKMATSIEEKFPKDGIPLLAEELLLNRVVELDKGTRFIRQIYNNVHHSSCASLYYACGVYEPRQNMILSLLSKILHEQCFGILKTQEQLGVLVRTKFFVHNGTHGLRITVQGDKHPEFLEQRIEAFMQGFGEYLQNMSDEEFLTQKAAAIASKLEKPQNIYSKAYKLWVEIKTQEYNFDRAAVETELLKTITKEELILAFTKYFSADSPERRKLSIHVISTAEGGAGKNDNTSTGSELEDNSSPGTDRKEIITNLVEFKSRRKLYPNPIPFTSVPRKDGTLSS